MRNSSTNTTGLVVEDASAITIDLFPAEVEVNGTSYGEANKIIVTDNRVYVIQPGPVIVYESATDYDSFDRSSRSEYTVLTGTADIVTFRRARNCGCGSQLRGIHPFMGVPYAPRKPVTKTND